MQLVERSGGGFKGDLVAEGFQMLDVSKPGRDEILRLHREQVHNDFCRAGRGRSGQQFRAQPLREDIHLRSVPLARAASHQLTTTSKNNTPASPRAAGRAKVTVVRRPPSAEQAGQLTRLPLPHEVSPNTFGPRSNDSMDSGLTRTGCKTPPRTRDLAVPDQNMALASHIEQGTAQH